MGVGIGIFQTVGRSDNAHLVEQAEKIKAAGNRMWWTLGPANRERADVRYATTLNGRLGAGGDRSEHSQTPVWEPAERVEVCYDLTGGDGPSRAVQAASLVRWAKQGVSMAHTAAALA